MEIGASQKRGSHGSRSEVSLREKNKVWLSIDSGDVGLRLRTLLKQIAAEKGIAVVNLF